MIIKNVCPITDVDGITVNRMYLCDGSCYVYNSREVKYIVMHYTGNKKDCAEVNARAFYNHRYTCNASAHYFVDDSEIYQSKALCNAAWHCGGTSKYKHPECRNVNSIGIEMACCGGNYTVTAETIANAVKLCGTLCRMLGITADTVDKYVIRHYDVWSKNCPAAWAGENNVGWNSFKAEVKEYIKGEGKLNMSQYEELKNEIDVLKSEKKVYNWIKDIPAWAKTAVEKMYNEGILEGDENGALQLSEDMLRVIVLMQRMLER